MESIGNKERLDHLRTKMEELEQQYEANGIINWPTFVAGGPETERMVVEVRQKDFEKGTLRVTRACCVRFVEDVSFNPNRPGMLKDFDGNDSAIDPARKIDWFPDMDDPEQVELYGGPDSETGSAYQLGFFAAITIENGSGTIIDLNNYTLEMHPEFALQQRFHALIELADQPFVFRQGPSKSARGFGRNLRPTNRLMIRNGTLGRSSHHGIHGNNPRNVVLADLTMRDYEVAGISINGPRNLLIEDCILEGTRTDIPVLGTYSAGRFALLATKRLSDYTKDLPTEVLQRLETAQSRLERALNDVFDTTIFGKSLSKPEHKEASVFLNSTGLSDGNAYGIAIHARGVLVGPFVCRGVSLACDVHQHKSNDCCTVSIKHTSIADTRAQVREVVALAPVKAEDAPKSGPVADAGGAVFQFFSDGEQPGNWNDAGHAVLTCLGAIQVAISEAVAALPVDNRPPFPRSSLPDSIQKWCGDSTLKLRQSGDVPRFWQLDDLANTKFEIRCNGDTMHHVNKGVIGLFIQAVSDLEIDDVSVISTSNAGAPGSDKSGPYRSASDGGHADQAMHLGYTGADARGAYIGACTDADISRLRSWGVTSSNGDATGIEISGGSEAVMTRDCSSGNVFAGTELAESPVTSLPNGPAIACGLRVARETSRVALLGYRPVGDVKHPGPYPVHELEICSVDVTMNP